MIDNIMSRLTSKEDKLALLLSCRIFTQLIRKAGIEITKTSDAFFRLNQQIGSGGNCNRWALCYRCGKLRPTTSSKWPAGTSVELFEAYGYIGVSELDQILYVSECTIWHLQHGDEASAIKGKHNRGECPQCYLEKTYAGAIEGRKYY